MTNRFLVLLICALFVLSSSPLTTSLMSDHTDRTGVEETNFQSPKPNFQSSTINSNNLSELVTITFVVTTLEPVSTLQLENILFVDKFVTDNHPMVQSEDDPNTFSLSLELKPGTLFKYRYSTGWQQWEIMHPASANDPPERSLIIPQSDTTIHDEVIGFIHLNNMDSIDFVNVTGRVTDNLGQPINSGVIWVGGKKSGININGTFYLYNTLSGNQKVTIMTYNHYPVTQVINISDGTNSNHEVDIGTFSVEPAPKVNLVLNVQTPDTPMDMPVKIFGDHPDLGYDRPFFAHENTVVLTQINNEGWYQLNMEISVGTPITYIYTFGSHTFNYEITDNIRPVFRNLVIWKDTVINERVEQWKTDDHYTMTFRVHVPENTPNLGVNFFMGNGLVEMIEVSRNIWETVVFVPPFGNEISYYYQLGTYTGLYAERDYDQFNQRTVTLQNTTITDTVAGWRWVSNATGSPIDGKVNISLSITVPYYTPPDDNLYLVGDIFESGTDWQNPQGKILKKLDGHSYGVNLTLDLESPVILSVTRGSWSTMSETNFTITPRYSGQSLNGYVSDWVDLQPLWNRTNLISGIMPIDFWHPDMKEAVSPSFQEFAKQGGQWVEIAVILTMTHTSPTLFIKSSYFLNFPHQDLKYVINEAHKAGLKVYLDLALGESQSEIEDGLNLRLNETNWEDYSNQVKSMILFYTKLAQEIGIEMIKLPGYIGHNTTLVDELMRDTINSMRDIYQGLIVSSSGAHQVDFTYYELVDFVGMVMWENILVGVENPTIEEMVIAFTTILDNKYKDFQKTHGKPILFSQMAYSTLNDSNFAHNLPEGTPSSISQFHYQPSLQAKIYEAFMRAIVNRTWIVGLFSFGWSYWEETVPTYSINHHLAQSVLLKWGNAMNNTKIIDMDHPKFDITSNSHVNFTAPSYEEYRIGLGIDPVWSNWSTTSEVDIKDLHQQYNTSAMLSIWFQARNEGEMSYPWTLRSLFDQNVPQLYNEPTNTIYQSNSSSFGDLLALINSEKLLVWKFTDTSDLDIEFTISGPSSHTATIENPVLVIPVASFGEGDWTVAINVYDEVGFESNTKHSFTIKVEEPTSPPDTQTSTQNSNGVNDGNQTTNTSLLVNKNSWLLLLILLTVSRLFKGLISKSRLD